MTRFFLDTSVTVSRLSSASDKESYAAYGTVTGHMQPMDEQTVILAGGAPGQVFKLYTEQEADLQVTDKVVIGSTTYIVRGKEEYNFGSFPHAVWLVEEVK